MNSVGLAYLPVSRAASLLEIGEDELWVQVKNWDSVPGESRELNPQGIEALELGGEILITPRAILLLAERQGDARMRIVAEKLVKEGGESDCVGEGEMVRRTKEALELVTVPQAVRALKTVPPNLV